MERPITEHAGAQTPSVEQTEQEIREYLKSPQFTEDLMRAFAAAVEQAQQENERLGVVIPKYMEIKEESL